MGAHSRHTKVLRIAIIQDKKIVQERLIKAGESVTIGESPRNTFVFPKTDLPVSEYSLFDWKGDHYVLRFSSQVRGKLNTGSGVSRLSSLRDEETTTRDGSDWLVPLSVHQRGKIQIDPVTVLFQFVSPPPVQAVRPLEAMDFRPRLVDEDDPVFLGFVAVFSALAVVFAIWIFYAEEPPQQSIEDLPDRFTQLILQKPETPPAPDDADLETDDDGTVVASEEPEPTAPEPADDEPAQADTEPASAQDEAVQKEALKQEVLQNSQLLKIIGIGTTGENSRGTIDVLAGNGAENFGDLEARLNEVGTANVQLADSSNLRGGSNTGGTGDRDIGDMTTSGGGDSTGLQRDVPQVVRDARVELGDGSFDGVDGDQGAAKKVVRRYQGQVKYCYETQLKANPSLAGRVVVDLVIVGDVVDDVFISTNTTGDQTLADCIAKKVKRWKFSGIGDAEFSFPLVLRPTE